MVMLIVSGKLLCYNVLVLEEFMNNLNVCVFYLFFIKV